ncbi:MAG: DUF6288 domain-containing protein, partial [Planctomycetota bacterium]
MMKTSPRKMTMLRAHLVTALLVLPAIAAGAPGESAEPLKVFILAGQSNMQGHAHVSTFDAVGLDPKTAPMLEEMRNADGTPRVCDSVWITSIGSANEEQVGRLTAGFGAKARGPKIGPEFTFGIYMHERLGEPILIIKTAWGGKSLHTDFRPPGADKANAPGHYYRLMIEHVKKVLVDIGRVYPEYDPKQGHELAGFVWFQGWNDMVDRGQYPDRNRPGGYDTYSELLAQLVRDVRADLAAPELPFVIGVMGVGGPIDEYGPEQQRYQGIHRNFRLAMAAPADLPEFRGNVVAVPTAEYWDMQVVALRAREREIKPRVDEIDRAVKEGTLSREEGSVARERIYTEIFTERELVILRESTSNADYHYMGSAKIIGQVGKAFAEALFGMMENASPAAAPPTATAGPDFTRGEAIPEGATHDWNLGPTGARGWMYSNKMETSEARQVSITKVDEGSPAAGVLRRGDVLLGVAGRTFRFDPRTELGQAIGDAEASGGRLSLIRWRDGQRQRVVVQLPVLGRYSRTAPFDCRKSQRILEQGCAALAERMAAAPNQGNPIERSYNALALLASGRPEYLPLVRAQVEWASKYSDLERRTLHSWWYGPVNMLLAEYVLATGDRSFMPDLKRITMEIVRGQSPVGSWGHRFVQENGRLAGYGMMNAPGLPLTVSLILAREAGVDDPALDAAIRRSARLIRFYVGKGSVPYGDHHPWIEAHDDNGKNGIAALMFNLLDDAEAVGYFSRMSVASHGGERDTGHTGNFFNMLWAMPGVALSGPHATGAWMKEFGWYY